MGMLFSRSGSDNDASDDGCKTVTVRSISFNGDDINTILRTLSFSKPDTQSSTPKFLGSERMVLEGFLSYKVMKADQVQEQTTFSIANPCVEKEDLTEMSGGSKYLQVNNSQLVSQNPCISHVENRKRGEDMTASSAESCLVDKEDSVKIASIESSEFIRQEESPKLSVIDSDSPQHEAAVKLQKVYKSFRTRRQLADCAVLVEQSWWKVLDFALLKHSSYFDAEKPESIGSRWSRARARAAKVGKGLSKDAKARKLARQHWLEAIDPRHRYGHNLHIYYDSWLQCESKQPFFYWLDVGEGKEENLECCPRSKLQQQCIKYLGPKEREAYEVMIEDGKFIYKQTRELVDTFVADEESKWIFVLSTSKTLYVGQKKKGTFQHSSFLAGGATSSAGRLIVEKGILKAICPHSGHYRPTEENFLEFVSFLEENNVDLTDVKKSPTEDEFSSQSGRSNSFRRNLSRFSLSKELAQSEAIISNCKEASKLQTLLVSDGKANAATVETLMDPFLEEEEKSCSLSAESQASVDATRKEAWSFDHFHASHAQDLIRGSNGESEEYIDFPANRNAEVTENLGATAANYDETSFCNLNSDEALEPIRSDYIFQKRNLFEEEEVERQELEIPQELILKRINSKKAMKSLQLGKQLSFKWTTGAGPRISCVRDYPPELQFRALEQVSLSPRSTGNCKASVSSSPRSIANQTSKSILS